MEVLDPCVGERLFREPVRLSLKPDSLACVRFSQWYRTALQSHDQHRPLVVVEAITFGHLAVGKVAHRGAFTSHGAGRERQRLPRMPHIVEAVTIRPVAVLPRLAPGDAGKNKNNRRLDAVRRGVKTTQRPLPGHMRRWPVMIQAIRPIRQAMREEVELGRVQIPRRRVHAQRIRVSGGGYAFGSADGRRIEQ